MKTIRPAFLRALCLAALFGNAPSAFSQRAFSLNIAGTNNNGTVITWTSQSATPVGDLLILPQFVVQRSDDLQSWTSISDRLTAPVSKKLLFTDTNAIHAFYRVQSIIQDDYPPLAGAILDSGPLSGADFLGADLFGASLQNASLAGAEFAGADLRNADFSGADLRGADLFAAFGSQTTFDSSDLTGADCSFGNFEASSFFNCDLTGVDFSSATLDNVDFDFAFLKDVQLDEN